MHISVQLLKTHLTQFERTQQSVLPEHLELWELRKRKEFRSCSKVQMQNQKSVVTTKETQQAGTGFAPSPECTMRHFFNLRCTRSLVDSPVWSEQNVHDHQGYTLAWRRIERDNIELGTVRTERNEKRLTWLFLLLSFASFVEKLRCPFHEDFRRFYLTIAGQHGCFLLPRFLRSHRRHTGHRI